MLTARLGLTFPLVQAPMAGVATPALAVAVAQAGGLGSLGLGASTPAQAREMIAAVTAQTDRPINLNFFVHASAPHNAEGDGAWCKAFEPAFAQFGAVPPQTLREIYAPLSADEEMQRVLLEAQPAVASFHFGLPPDALLRALKARGVLIMATATCVPEAVALEKAGVDILVAQGVEAGGHRGIFDTTVQDTALSTLVLTQHLKHACSLPVVAAGGVMTGQGIAAVCAVGAVGAQLGTAFIACPESAANAAYRAALSGPGAFATRMVHTLSGRQARCLPNLFTEFASSLPAAHCPPYPRAYDLAKALNNAAIQHGEGGFAAQWAGQGAPLARALPAATLMARLKDEYFVAARLS